MNDSLPALHLEDLHVGQRFTTATYEVTSDNLHGYAAEYDPQAIHLDESAATEGFFGELISSGWQVLSVSMKLMVESRPFGATPIIGVEVNDIRFRKPVVPGDVLHVEAQITEARPSSRPGRGYVCLDLTTYRDGDEPVTTQSWKLLVPRRD